jgi:CHAD domain-containing protein
MPKRKIKWDERRDVAGGARRVLPRLVAGYFAEVREFLAKDREPMELHRMRLAAKRLRNTLELFLPCYGIGLKQRLETLKKLQDSLGDVNDAVATRALLDDSANRKVQAFLEARAEEKAAEFRKHWAESFDAPEREAWWVGYLERNAKAPAVSRARKRSLTVAVR